VVEDTSTERAILEGHISISAAMEAQSREIYGIQISVDSLDRPVQDLERRARALGIRVQRVEPGVIQAQVTGQTHGGVIAQVGPRRFVALEDLLAHAQSGTPQAPLSRKTPPLVVMLDGIEDPFNFGAAVRSLYAAGVDGLVLRPRNWMSAASTVVRSSGGASELIPTAIAETVLDAAEFYSARGLKVAVAARGRSVSIFEADLAVPLFLAIGGEKRGLSRPLVERADLRLEIPYGRRWPVSLGTAAATAVLAFEIMRQRSRK
jgi:23S rRNA (guanosine2251-2'-O)-methyltransferase